MTLKNTLINDLTAAMKAKDAERLSTLRMAKAALMNREIEKGAELSDEETQKMLQSLIKQRHDSVEQYEKAGRAELAAKERAEIAVLEKYLPQAASAEELAEAVALAIEESGAQTMREMGAVMKLVQAKLAGKTIDNRAVSEQVKARLG